MINMDVGGYEPEFVTQLQDIFLPNLLFSSRTCCGKLRKLLWVKHKLKQLLWTNLILAGRPSCLIPLNLCIPGFYFGEHAEIKFKKTSTEFSSVG